MSESNFQVTPENEAEVLEAAKAAEAEARGETQEVEPTDDSKPNEDAEDVKTEETQDDADEGDGLEIKAKDDEADDEGDEDENKVDEADRVNIATVFDEYRETGTLSEETEAKVQAALDRAGFDNPEQLLAGYIAGYEAQREAARGEVFEMTGGEDNYKTMVQWAAENFSEAQITKYNEMVNDPDSRELAVSGLKAKFDAAGGKTASPRLDPGPTVPGGGGQGSLPKSDLQVAELVGTRQYKTDPAHRADVDARINRAIELGYLK